MSFAFEMGSKLRIQPTPPGGHSSELGPMAWSLFTSTWTISALCRRIDLPLEERHNLKTCRNSPSLKLTASLHLKLAGKMNFLVCFVLFSRDELLVLGRYNETTIFVSERMLNLVESNVSVSMDLWIIEVEKKKRQYVISLQLCIIL